MMLVRRQRGPLAALQEGGQTAAVWMRGCDGATASPASGRASPHTPTTRLHKHRRMRRDGMGWDGMGWDGMGWDGMGWDGAALAGGQRDISIDYRPLWQPRAKLAPTTAAPKGRWLSITVQLHQGTELLPLNSPPFEITTRNSPSPTRLCWGPCKLQGTCLDGNM